MEDLPCIDIEGKQLAYTNKEVSKLTDADGCHLSVITSKVHNLDDDGYSNSDEEENSCHLIDDVADSKTDHVKREYLSVLLQMDQLGKKPKIKSEQLECESSLRDHIQEIIDTEGANSSINKLYRDLGKFDENINSAKFVEISSNRVYKNRLIIGEQIPIQDDSFVVFNFALWRESMSEPFDSTWNRQKPATVNLKSDPLLPGLYELLMTMKQGEWCEAYFRPEAAFGRIGAMPRIPPNATLFCLIQVVKVVANDKLPMNLRNDTDDNDVDIFDFETIHQMSEEARKQGNYFREKNNFKAALTRYFSGVRMLEGFTYRDEVEESQGKDVLIKLFNNIASTANKAGYPRMALKACKDAIELNGGNEKTYYNKMIAWKRKGHPDRALMVARRAMQLFDNDPKKVKVFRGEADKLKRLIAQEQSDTNKLYQLMGSAYSEPRIMSKS